MFLRYVVAQPPHIKHVIYRHIQDLVARDEHLRENLKAEAHTLPDIVLTEVCRSFWRYQTYIDYDVINRGNYATSSSS